MHAVSKIANFATQGARQLADRRDAVVICPSCGKRIARKARQQRFCSVKCRQRGAYAQKVARGAFSGRRGIDTRLSTKPPKIVNKSNGLQPAKLGSSPRIIAPRRVIEAEIISGRHWCPVVSASGIACEVAVLRLRTRWNGGAS